MDRHKILKKKFLITKLVILSIFTVFLIYSCQDDEKIIETVEIGFSQDDFTVLENNKEGALVEVNFEAASAKGSFSIELIGAEYGVDYTTNPDGSSGEFVIPVEIGRNTRSFLIKPINNNTINEDKVISIKLKDPSGGIVLSNTNTTATITIIDDEESVEINFDKPTLTVEETDTDGIDVLINFDNTLQFDGSFDISLSGATLGADFTTSLSGTKSPLTVDVEAGQKNLNFTIIPINNNVESSDDVTITASLENPTSAFSIGKNNTQKIVIVDDDGESNINFDSSSYILAENGSTIDINMSIFPALQMDATVDINLSSTDAIYGTDYTTIPDSSSGTITLNMLAGSDNTSFQIVPIDNNAGAPDKILELSLSNLTGPIRIGNIDTSTVAIDSEEPFIFAYTSFEEPVIPSGISYGFYSASINGNTDADLVNTATHTPVDYTSTGGEIGFDAKWKWVFDANIRFENWGIVNQNREASSGSGNFEGEVSIPSIPDGDQIYRVSNVDGIYVLTFDTVNLTNATSPKLSLELFVANESVSGQASSYDGLGAGLLYDFIRLYVVTDNGTELNLLDTQDTDIDSSFGHLKGVWTNFSIDLTGYNNATLTLKFRSTDARELVGLDNIQFIDE